MSESLKPIPLRFWRSANGRESVRDWLNELRRDEQRIVGRDIGLALRQGVDSLMVVMFFVIAVVLFPFGVGPEPNLLREIAPGVVWVSALLAAMPTQASAGAAPRASGAERLRGASAPAREEAPEEGRPRPRSGPVRPRRTRPLSPAARYFLFASPRAKMLAT